MANGPSLDKILFLDIETVPAWPDYQSMPDHFRTLWEHKSGYLKRNETDTPELLYQRAGIYAEFGKIVCISVGHFYGEKFRMKSFYGHDEKKLLTEFADMLDKFCKTPEHALAAHNGKEFDFPYISRRMLVHQICLPVVLDNQGRKPWEVTLIDTMELWKFGDYKHYTSLALLAALFDLPTPKGDIDGSQVARVYYEDGDLERIARYCQLDTLTVARLYCRFKLLAPPTDDQIVIIS
ncbi:MAG: ribonuclease H-like domain-containing protein [Bacteroidales bacterium]